MFDFIAIDFETATKQMAPCQVGIAIVENGKIIETFGSFINPEQKFDAGLSRIHGINSALVANAPTFPILYGEKLKSLLNHYPFVAHNAAFDRKVIVKTCERYGLSIPKTTFFCTAKLYQENFPNLQHYSLDFLCAKFNIELCQHHDAVADAVACANLFIDLLKNPQTTIFAISPDSQQVYPHKSTETITSFPKHREVVQHAEHIEIALNYEQFSGTFQDFRFVITGDIPECSREELSQMIIARGGKVTATVGVKTDFVAVGSLDTSLVADKETFKSGKIKKAEALIAEGKKIKFIHLHDLYSALTSK